MTQDSKSTQPWAWIGIGAMLAYVLGVIGWFTALPEAPLHEPFYRALQLFTLNAEWESTTALIPCLLNLARFLAAGVAFVAVIKVVLALLQDWTQIRRAMRQRRHISVVGRGPEAVELALNYVSLWFRQGWWRRRRGRVVVIADLAPSGYIGLHKAGAIVIPAVTDQRLAQIIQGSCEIVVVGESDDETAELAARVAKGNPEVTPMAVFDSPELTRHWEAEKRVRVRPVSRLSQVAITVLRQNPPISSTSACPAPIVIGDGALAAEIARRMVAGWQQPGESMVVHCVGEKLRWVERARSGIDDIADLQATEVCLASEIVGELVQSLVGLWVTPPENKATVAGPTVVIALDEEGTGVSLAASLLRNIPDVRVSVIVTRESTWRAIFGDDNGHRFLVGSLDVMSQPDALKLDRVEMLTDAILMDAADWAAEGGAAIGKPLLGKAGRPLPLVHQPDMVQNAVSAIIGTDHTLGHLVGLEELLEAGSLTLKDPGTVRPLHLLNPSQITAMRNVLLQRLGNAVPGIGGAGSLESWAMETAERLPVLCSRAGWVPNDVSGRPTVLSADLVAELARIVHRIYNEVSAETDNATGSEIAGKPWDELDEFNKSASRAAVRDLPVKLATLGLEWRSLAWAKPYALTVEEIERLAEAEHRRWARYQRHNGRPDHHLVIPWHQIKSDEQRDYDRRIVVGLFQELAARGIQVHRSPILEPQRMNDG